VTLIGSAEARVLNSGHRSGLRLGMRVHRNTGTKGTKVSISTVYKQAIKF